MENQNYYFEGENQEKSFNFSKVFFRAIRFWYIVVICMVLSIGIGFYIYKTRLPQYKIASLLLVSDPQNDQEASVGSENAMPGVNLGKYSNIQNQIILLTSKNHIEKVIKQLDFTISYYEKELFLFQEIYKKAPFIVTPDSAQEHLSYDHYFIRFSDDKSFTLRNEKHDEEEHSFKFFEKINLYGQTFTIRPVQNIITETNYIGKEYSFKINSLNNLINQYQRKVLISPYQRGSSIYEISISENNIYKGIDFLNKLSKSAVQYNLDKKNQIANNTISFIENQIIGVSDSLSSAEKVLENFRSRNELMDVSMQGQMIINQSQELENRKSGLLLKLDYYNYLVSYIENNKNVQELMAPSSMGVDNPILTQLIGELSSKNAEKSSLQFNSRIENPNITRINRHIGNLKTSILENTKSLISTTNLSLEDLNKRLMGLSSQIRKLPKTEQLLLGIERKFKMNDDMYTYLLERRSEAQLAKAANLADNEIIEKATAQGKVVPDKKRVIIIIILLGLLFPSVIIFLIIFLNNKVQDKEDLVSLTKHPIIGEIPSKGKLNEQVAFIQNPKSSFAEAIRTIRTNLNFYPSENNCKTILVTSSIPGEGKTFISINLAASYAQLGKKTIILGFDLRKPKLTDYLNINSNSSGLSRFLVSNSEKISHHLIEPTHIPNLEVISTGEIPPNPAELIAGVHTQVLFEELKKIYEVIIIDTPPISLVTDAQLLAKYSDINVITTRHNITTKPILRNLINDGKLKNLKNLCIIINGLPKDRRGYSYGYNGDYYSN